MSRDYLDFLDDVLIFRAYRAFGDPQPEIWMDKALDRMNPGRDDEKHLPFAAKMAELIDDRKQWLLDELSEEVSKALTSPAGPAT